METYSMTNIPLNKFKQKNSDSMVLLIKKLLFCENLWTINMNKKPAM